MRQASRAERREAERELKKFIRRANRGYDPTVPLTYVGGFIHEGCGGEAEMPSNRGAGAYCTACGHTVPVEELRR